MLQVGSAEDLYQRPTSPEVAQFLGAMNWMEGTTGPGGMVRTPLGDLQMDCGDLTAGAPVTLGVRPEYVRLTVGRGPLRDGEIALAGTIARGTYFGDHTPLPDTGRQPPHHCKGAPFGAAFGRHIRLHSSR